MITIDPLLLGFSIVLFNGSPVKTRLDGRRGAAVGDEWPLWQELEKSMEREIKLKEEIERIKQAIQAQAAKQKAGK